MHPVDNDCWDARVLMMQSNYRSICPHDELHFEVFMNLMRDYMQSKQLAVELPMRGGSSGY